MASSSVAKQPEYLMKPVKNLLQFIEESDQEIFKTRDKKEFKDVLTYLLAQLKGLKTNQSIPKISDLTEDMPIYQQHMTVIIENRISLLQRILVKV